MGKEASLQRSEKGQRRFRRASRETEAISSPRVPETLAPGSCPRLFTHRRSTGSSRPLCTRNGESWEKPLGLSSGLRLPLPPAHSWGHGGVSSRRELGSKVLVRPVLITARQRQAVEGHRSWQSC